MEFTLNEIAHLVDGEVIGNGDVKISNIAKIEEASEGDISFLSNPKYEQHLYSTKASAVIVNNDFIPKREVKIPLLRVDDAYSGFTTLLEEYYRISSYSKHGTEDPAFIGNKSNVGMNIYRGAFSYIGENCTIGDNVKIYPHVYIGDNVSIGDNTILYAGAKIYSDTKIGHHCTIHSGCVIGSDGFGFAPQKDGTYKTIPQVGNVIIKNHVSIGANTVIDCATMGSTMIEDGVKLDNLIQIAHNVEIGTNTVMAAQAGVSGSAKIGKNCMIAGQVGITGHLVVADKTSIGAQAGIMSDTKSGSVIIGSPALDHKAYLKSYAVFKKLPEITRRLEQLEEKIINLRST